MIRWDPHEIGSRIPVVHWRRKWQSTPVFLPGEPHGQQSLVGYSPWGCESWTRLIMKKNNSHLGMNLPGLKGTI